MRNPNKIQQYNSLTVQMASGSYKQAFCKFMEFKLNSTVALDRNITETELLSITPQDIVRYFNIKAYGVEEPGEGDFPCKCRSGTLLNI